MSRPKSIQTPANLAAQPFRLAAPLRNPLHEPQPFQAAVGRGRRRIEPMTGQHLDPPRRKALPSSLRISRLRCSTKRRGHNFSRGLWFDSVGLYALRSRL
jgi:hypothetical protein